MGRIRNQLPQWLIAGLLGTWIVTSGWTALAAEAWSLPNSGIRMETEEKQAYIAEKMEKLFHSPSAAAATAKPFSPPAETLPLNCPYICASITDRNREQ